MEFSLDSFLKSGHSIEYKRNEHLLIQGDVSKRVFFVIEGVVRHYVIDYSGNEKTIRISKEQDFFYSSNVSYWTGEPSYINCQALLDTKLIFWTKDELDALRVNQPEFAKFETAKLKDFIVEKHNKEISRIIKDAEERLIEFNETDLILFNRIPHHIIASYLDMTPETVSRLRAKFKKRKS